MPRLALIDLADKSVLREVATGGWVELPNGSRVSPALAGWEGGGDIAYAKTDQGETAVEGPPRYAIVEIDAFVVPEGKRTIGPARLTVDDKTGKAVETAELDDPPPPLTADDKVAALLSSFDLTLAEFLAVISTTVKNV